MKIVEIIQRIAELQPKYSSQSTAAMQERGRLIRTELPSALEARRSQLAHHLGKFAPNFSVGGSDGIGRKTQAPWVRIFDSELSPSATSGYYMVIHFSVDGKHCFVTVGCGSTTWNKEKGDFDHAPAPEMKRRVQWARGRLNEAGLEFSDFDDPIVIGSQHRLPKQFERATVVGRRLEVDTLTEKVLLDAIAQALAYLSAIYERAAVGGDKLQSDAIDQAIEALVDPVRGRGGNRQGYGLSGPERKAVELRAMDITRAHLEAEGFQVEDTSAKYPFDFLAEKPGVALKVEVKGTTSDQADAIMMTANEVALHSNEQERTALAIVSGIEFVLRGDDAQCEGGTLEWFDPWDISEWEVVPKAFVITRR